MAEQSSRPMAWKRKINAPIETVYRAWTQPMNLRDWLCDAADADARPGGRFYAWWRTGSYAAGHFIKVEPGVSLLLAWRGRDDPAETQVSLILRGEAELTRLELQHMGIPAEKSWNEAAEQIQQGWERALADLETLLETGFPARLLRRPRIGLEVEDFTPSPSRGGGLAGPAGIVVNQVHEGGGAQKAGLREKDRLIEMDSQAIARVQDLVDVLEQHQAGDTIPVLFLRDGAQQTAQVTLAKSPAVKLPTTARELAESGREVREQLYRDLEKTLKERSEDQCEYRPEGAWTVKEHLAHLILSERDVQTWLASLMSDITVADAPQYSANVLTRLEAVINIYPTVPELLKELKRTQAELLTFLGLLPDLFIRRKNLFRRIATWVSTNADHYREHVRQIEQCLSGQ